MSSINGTSPSQPIFSVPRVDNQTGKGNPAIQEENGNTQQISHLAQKPDMLSLMLEMQSLRPNTMQTTSTAPQRKNYEATSDSDVPVNIIRLSVASEVDANKAERLTAVVPGSSTSQLNITQPNNKPAENSKISSESTNASASSSGTSIRSQPLVVGGGTDITAAGDAAPVSMFVNMMGPLNQLELSNKLATVQLDTERNALQAAAQASQRGFAAAGRAGDQMIAAAKEHFNGAITAGVLGMTGQAASSGMQFKSLRNEGKSLTHNVKPATNIERGVREQNNAIASSKDKMVHEGNTLPSEVKATMNRSEAADISKSETLRNNHSKVTLATQKVRVGAEYANQAINSVKSSAENAFGISASEKQKEAELARADRDVNNELASTQNQMARKAAEAHAAIKNMTDSVLNSNNSAVSSIAERAR